MIIDKPVEKLGSLEIDEWEAWIDDRDMRRYAKDRGGELEIIPSLKYEGGRDDGLFRAWIVRKGER